MIRFELKSNRSNLSKFENRKLLPLIEDHTVEYHKITQDSNEKRVIHYILATVKSLKFRFNFKEEAVLIVNFEKFRRNNK